MLSGCASESQREPQLQVEIRISNAASEPRAVDVVSLVREGSDATVDGFARKLEPGEHVVEAVKAAASGTIEVRAFTTGKMRRLTWKWSKTLMAEDGSGEMIYSCEIDR
ncbi:hypothetical protein HY251_13210 [bacterium]|nr:hypothetical protein [bacterium]